MPGQMDWMRHITAVIENPPVTAVLLHAQRIRIRPRLAVHHPVIDLPPADKLVLEYYWQRVSRSGFHTCIAERRVAPALTGWRQPSRLSGLPGIFEDNPHAAGPFLVIRCTHNPNAGIIHFNDGIDSLGRPELEHRRRARRGDFVSIESRHPESVAR